MNLVKRLGALSRQVRGWLPERPWTATRNSFDWRGAMFVGAGTFFIIVGAIFLVLEQILGGPVTYVNCLPGMSCQAIGYDTSPVMPPFLIVFGIVVIGIGFYYHSLHGNAALART